MSAAHSALVGSSMRARATDPRGPRTRSVPRSKLSKKRTIAPRSAAQIRQALFLRLSMPEAAASAVPTEQQFLPHSRPRSVSHQPSLRHVARGMVDEVSVAMSEDDTFPPFSRTGEGLDDSRGRPFLGVLDNPGNRASAAQGRSFSLSGSQDMAGPVSRRPSSHVSTGQNPRQGDSPSLVRHPAPPSSSLQQSRVPSSSGIVSSAASASGSVGRGLARRRPGARSGRDLRMGLLRRVEALREQELPSTSSDRSDAAASHASSGMQDESRSGSSPGAAARTDLALPRHGGARAELTAASSALSVPISGSAASGALRRSRARSGHRNGDEALSAGSTAVSADCGIGGFAGVTLVREHSLTEAQHAAAEAEAAEAEAASHRSTTERLKRRLQRRLRRRAGAGVDHPSHSSSSASRSGYDEQSATETREGATTTDADSDSDEDDDDSDDQEVTVDSVLPSSSVSHDAWIASGSINLSAESVSSLPPSPQTTGSELASPAGRQAAPSASRVSVKVPHSSVRDAIAMATMSAERRQRWQRGPERRPRRILSHSDSDWVSSVLVKECQHCGARFGLLLRKHHCRRCGACLCAACTPYSTPKVSRQCRRCHALEAGRVFWQPRFQPTLSTQPPAPGTQPPPRRAAPDDTTVAVAIARAWRRDASWRTRHSADSAAVVAAIRASPDAAVSALAALPSAGDTVTAEEIAAARDALARLSLSYPWLLESPFRQRVTHASSGGVTHASSGGAASESLPSGLWPDPVVGFASTGEIDWAATGADADAFADAAAAGDAEEVRSRIRHGQAVTATQPVMGNTPLHGAASSNSVAALSEALAATSAGAAVNALSFSSRTPLHTAAAQGAEATAAVLLESGADAAAEDADGFSPLDLAWLQGYGVKMTKMPLVTSEAMDLARRIDKLGGVERVDISLAAAAPSASILGGVLLTLQQAGLLSGADARISAPAGSEQGLLRLMSSLHGPLDASTLTLTGAEVLAALAGPEAAVHWAEEAAREGRTAARTAGKKALLRAEALARDTVAAVRAENRDGDGVSHRPLLLVDAGSGATPSEQDDLPPSGDTESLGSTVERRSVAPSEGGETPDGLSASLPTARDDDAEQTIAADSAPTTSAATPVITTAPRTLTLRMPPRAELLESGLAALDAAAQALQANLMAVVNAQVREVQSQAWRRDSAASAIGVLPLGYRKHAPLQHDDEPAPWALLPQTPHDGAGGLFVARSDQPFLSVSESLARRFEACGLLAPSRRHAMGSGSAERRLVGEAWRLGHWYGGDADLSTLIDELAEEQGLCSFRARPVAGLSDSDEETGDSDGGEAASIDDHHNDPQPHQDSSAARHEQSHGRTEEEPQAGGDSDGRSGLAIGVSVVISESQPISGAGRDGAASADAQAGSPSSREAFGGAGGVSGGGGFSPHSGTDGALSPSDGGGYSPHGHQSSSMSVLAENGSGGDGRSYLSHDDNSGTASPYSPGADRTRVASPDSPAIDAQLHSTHKFGFRSDHDDIQSPEHGSGRPTASMTAANGSTGGSHAASASASASSSTSRWDSAATHPNTTSASDSCLSPTVAAVPLSGPVHTTVTSEEAMRAGLGLGWTHHYPHQLHTSGTVRRWYSGKAVAANTNVRSAGGHLGFRLQPAPARDDRAFGQNGVTRMQQSDETGQAIPGSGSTRSTEGALPALASSAPGMLGPHALWIANIRAAKAADSPSSHNIGGRVECAGAGGSCEHESGPGSSVLAQAGSLPVGMFQEEPDIGGSLRRGRSEESLALQSMRVTDDELEAAPFSLTS